MRFYRSDDLRRVLDLGSLMDFMAERHRQPRISVADTLIDAGPIHYLVRSAAGVNRLGSKLITITPGNLARGEASVQALFVIFDADGGKPLAVLEATGLTYWKTAADSGLASRLLSRADSETLLLCGAGGLAPWLVRAHTAARPSLKRILIWNRTAHRAGALAEVLRREGHDAVAEQDLPKAVAKADIITTATMARQPFLNGEWLEPGQHIDLVGSFGPDTREADDACVSRARVFTDSREAALHGVGDILAPLASGALRREQILGDHYDLAAGMAGRLSPGDITLFKNAGGAHLDLMTAEFLLRRLEKLLEIQDRA